MGVKKVGNAYKVESSESGKFYSVDLSIPSCNCASFLFRKNECRHIISANKFAESEKSGKEREAEIIDLIKLKGEINSMELIKKYGEEKIDEMLRLGDLIENNGRVRLLE